MAQELHFYETASGDWFYILERQHAPKDMWDWMEFADAFGPFPTYEAAARHEYESPSDTSGSTVVEYVPNKSIPKNALDLITERRVANNKARR